MKFRGKDMLIGGAVVLIIAAVAVVVVVYQRHVEVVQRRQAANRASYTTPYRSTGSDTDTDPGDSPEWATKLTAAVACLGKSKDEVVKALGAPRSTWGGPGSAFYGNPLEYIYPLAEAQTGNITYYTEHIGTEFGQGGAVTRVAAHFTEPGSFYGHDVTLPSAGEAWADSAGTTKPDTLYYEPADIRLDYPDNLKSDQDDRERNGILMFFTIMGHDRSGRAVLLRCGSDCYPALPEQRFNTQTNKSEVTGYAPNPKFHWNRARVFEVDVQPTWQAPDSNPNMQRKSVSATAGRIRL